MTMAGTTIQMTYASLFNREAIAIAKGSTIEKCGDENRAYNFLVSNAKEFRDKFKSKELALACSMEEQTEKLWMN